MNETKILQNRSAVFDTSVLIEHLEGTDLGELVFDKIISNPEIDRFYIAPIVDTELKYVLCRRLGYQAGIVKVNELLQDFILFTADNLRDKTAYIKCNFAISIADSYGIATAIILDVPIYIKREREIEKVFDSLSELVEIFYIDDL